MKKTLIALCLGVTLTAPAIAQTPVQLSIPGTNLPEGDVAGLRVSLLYGQTANVKGVDLAILGLSESQNFTGLGLNIWGAHRTTGHSKGLKLSFANWNDGSAAGADIGLANYTAGNMHGLQWGAINYAGSLRGLQLGFFNGTDRIEKGVQIGLINYDKSGTFVSDSFPVFPIINARF